MGMVAIFSPVSPDRLDDIKADPDLIEDFLFPEDEDGDEEPEGTIDLDKAWHGIHFLLCELAPSEDSPLALAVLGGTELGDDFGYGPARVLEPAEVRQIAEALSAVTVEQLQAAFDPAAMTAANIYPEIWERDGEEARDYLTHFFPTLVAFYQETASRGDGAVLYIA